MSSMTKILLTIVMVMISVSLHAKVIVVLGDSLSAGYGMPVEQSWVRLLQHKLDAEKKPFQVVNDSITGDTTAGGLARIDKLLKQYKPEILIVELGANDGLRGLSPVLMQSNLTEIIKRAKHLGAKVLLLGMRIPPNYGKRYTDMFYAVYAKLAKTLKVAWVPFILEDVALSQHLMQKDGLHPNAQAQPVILKTIWPKLLPLL